MIFTVLQKISFPSSKKSINVLIAVLISIIPPIYSFSYGFDYFEGVYDFFGQVGMFFYLSVFLIILFAAFGKPTPNSNSTVSGSFIIIVIAILFYSVISSFYQPNLPGFNSDWLYMVLIISCFYLGIDFITGNDLKEELSN